ncbi:hypothetical protein AB1Y20_011177 [Prymnesium parvum]|uniref:Uncharacterized protein n=1 Tax=Prymnesium parvum TaxID=97485 RepID=A0AB34INT9_PRYPA
MARTNPLLSCPHLSTLVAAPLRSAPLRSAPLRSSPLLSSPLHSAPLRPSPLRSSPLLSSPFLSPPLRSSPLLSIPLLSSPLLSVPLRSSPLLSSPLLSSPLLSVPLLSAPLLSSPLLSSPLRSAPLRSSPLLSAPLCSAPLLSSPLPSSPLPSSPRPPHPPHHTQPSPPAPHPARPTALSPRSQARRRSMSRSSNSTLEAWLRASAHELCPASCACAKAWSAALAPPPPAARARCERKELRQYLSAVYPTGRFGSLPRRTLAAFAATLDFFYDFGCAPAGCAEPGALLRFRYAALLPCVQRLAAPPYACLAAHHAFPPPPPARYVEVEHRSFGLGLPGAPHAPPRAAADVMDGGAGGMWYFLRRGSGVWLHAGRSKEAPGKNAMLAALLAELGRAPRLDAQWRALAARQRLFARAAGGGAAADGAALDATARGGATCAAAGVRRCRDAFVLDDSWDDAITWAGRALGYDTLAFGATLLAAARPPRRGAVEFVSAYAELVDLRLPDAAWREAQQRGAHPFLQPDATGATPLYARRKTAKAAELWLRRVREEGVLSLRDPLDPLDERRARPCNFSVGPTFVLRCAGHAPTRWKALPVGGAWDSCGIAMCGENDLRWR